MLGERVKIILDHPLAPPYVRCRLELKVLKKHWKCALNLWHVGWFVHQGRTAGFA